MNVGDTVNLGLLRLQEVANGLDGVRCERRMRQDLGHAGALRIGHAFPDGFRQPALAQPQAAHFRGRCLRRGAAVCAVVETVDQR